MELTFACEMKAEVVNIRKNEIRFSLSRPLKSFRESFFIYAHLYTTFILHYDTTHSNGG